jgi:ribonuclease PH
LVLCFRKLLAEGKISAMPTKTYVSGVSAGIVGGIPMLDLQYYEDSQADVDLNCVMDGNGGIIELQGTGEGRPFTASEQQKLLELCLHGNRLLQRMQRDVLGEL